MFYLDASSAAMLFGLLVHAGTSSDNYIKVFFASEQFRIHFRHIGDFCNDGIDRRGWRAFWQHRAMGLIIPLVTTGPWNRCGRTTIYHNSAEGVDRLVTFERGTLLTYPN
jgi:hypothetical protein